MVLRFPEEGERESRKVLRPSARGRRLRKSLMPDGRAAALVMLLLSRALAWLAKAAGRVQ